MIKSGFVLLDKPSGLNSRAAGFRVAKMFGTKKFGHVGTLDPMASGLLVIALGEATKMIPYLDANVHPKEYEFAIEWGIETDTGDITGKVVNTILESMSPNPDLLRAACAQLTGVYMQTPPQYSAVHIGGRRAYELARRGVAVEIPARKVTIYDLEYLGDNKFRVVCSPGTYVRSLARDIATLLGTIATCSMIRRTATNGFLIKNAVALDFLENLYNNRPADIEKHLMPVDFGLDDILVWKLNENDAQAFRNGNFIKVTGDQLPVTSELRRIYCNDKFLGIGKIDSCLLKPVRIIN